MADNRHTQNFAIARDHGLDHAARFALGAGAIIFFKRPAQNLDRFMPSPRFEPVIGLSEPDMSKFRACIQNARQGIEFGARGQMKQNIADDNTGLVSRRMGELSFLLGISDPATSPMAKILRLDVRSRLSVRMQS